MTKSELVRRMAELHPHLQHSEVERVVETIFTSIGEALARGGRIEIRGFGSFIVKYRSARLGKNPRTGATVEVSPKLIPCFRCGKHLHASLNEES
jgi:integration host factor subunit beta